MEDLVVRDVPVLITGHTGFKGAWLAEWLLQSGARVNGIALPPESPDGLFTALRLEERTHHVVADVRHRAGLVEHVRAADPELIFHLAAQALVRRSYRDPVGTWETNVVGTLNVLEAARALGRPVTVVVITSDKVYRNRERAIAFREEDELGGHDPYSASKAACELAVSSWRDCLGDSGGVRVATARAGNVLGGGDMSEDRIVPDCFRAWRSGTAVTLRNPGATRPWQHVLEPLSGYLALAAHLSNGRQIDACNFGPGTAGERTVEDLVAALAGRNPARRWTTARDGGPHEARALALSIERARSVLGWTPRLSFDDTVAWTDAGYSVQPSRLSALVGRQIADFVGRLTHA